MFLILKKSFEVYSFFYEVYKSLRDEEVWNNFDFMLLAIPLLAELDTESFHRHYLCPIRQEFEKERLMVKTNNYLIAHSFYLFC